MASSSDRTEWLIVMAAVLWHLFAVFSPPQQAVPPDTAGRDYASYHYAAQVALDGGNPYDKAQLDARARQDGTRSQVHPFFYPPPFLLVAAPIAFSSLSWAFDVWFLLNELCLLAACLILARWWAPLGRSVGPLLAVLVALQYGVAYGAELGQANALVLLAVIAGLALATRRRPEAGAAAEVAGGALLGLACMLKMSPALVVAWLLLRRRFVAVAAAVGTALVLTVLSLGVVGVAEQWAFYSDVLPGLGAGDYNGLRIKIGMFGNHSVPNLAQQLLPGASEHALSTGARMVSAGVLVTVLGGLTYLFERPTSDPTRIAAQASAVLLVMLLVPAYTYEHHLIFALPAMVLAAVALDRGWLGMVWAIPLGLAVAVLLFPLPHLRALSQQLLAPSVPAAAWVVQELKFAGLLTLLVAMARLGTTTVQTSGLPPLAPPPRPV
ncbi:MAG: DUF2029 domain-containing protein [Myxococcales bacterium]|nr:DUF2029 domain-containing protein [Myxococcales bacterium]